MNQKTIIKIRMLLCMIIFTAFSGCHSFRDHQNEKIISVRNRYRAHKAWKHAKKSCGHIRYPKDFSRGFKEGYYKVALGGNGCPPALPPRRYWSVRYQNHKGHFQQQRWFDGYEHGALAAEQDGVADMNYITTSNRVLHDQAIPENQHYEESISPEIEQGSLPALAPATDKPETSYSPGSHAPPLLPLTSPDPKSLPHRISNKTTRLEHQQNHKKASLANFQPFSDDVPDLDATEDLNIDSIKDYVYEDSKASLFEIRPSTKIEQVSFEKEQTPHHSRHHQKIQMKIRPKPVPGRIPKYDHDDNDWLMPQK